MKSLRWRLTFFIAVRTVLNTGYRMVYPFLPFFARGLGVDIETLSLALTVRAAAGSVGPLLAPLSDRHGRRFGMMLGLGLFAAGAAAPLLGLGWLSFAAALVVMTVGKYTFDPAMQAHLGDLVPYAKRGTAMAVAELGWSLAFIIGVPAAGFLVGRFGWRSPFLALAGLGVAALAGLRLLFPGLRAGAEEGPARPRHLENYRAVLKSAPALAGLAVIILVSASNEVVNVVFGVWLEDSFGLKIAALGAASAVIGISEFGGESLVAATIDRLGKTRALALGLAANTLAALLLPYTGRSTVSALAGLFALYLTFEYTIVGIIPVMSEILSEARATLLAFNTTAFSAGRALAAWLSPRLYAHGFPVVAAAAVAFNALAFLALWRLARLTAGPGIRGGGLPKAESRGKPGCKANGTSLG
jgi:DHA1 family inner membrane transport protein